MTYDLFQTLLLPSDTGFSNKKEIHFGFFFPTQYLNAWDCIRIINSKIHVQMQELSILTLIPLSYKKKKGQKS